MKKTITFFTSLLVMILMNMNVNAQFTAGNLVVLQVGDGTNALAATGNALSLVQFSPLGSLIDLTALPTTGNSMICLAGNASSEGQLSRSTDGTFLTLFGYKAAPPYTSSLTASLSANVSRTIVKINQAKTVSFVASTSTVFSAGNPRGIVSTGTDFWTIGSNTGVYHFAPSLSDSGLVSAPPTNIRRIGIINNQLYFTTGSGTKGLYKVGTGLPTTSGQTSTNMITSTGSPYSFDGNTTGNIIYIADDGLIAAGGGIQKWSNTGGVWTLAYTLGTGTGSTVGARDLLVDWSGTQPIIYAITAEASANRLIKIVDTNVTSVVTILATAPTTTAYRGIAFAPIPVVETYPTIATTSITNITSTTATCGGNITSDGGATITERGICYGTSINPDTTTKVIVTGTNTSFTGNLTSLTSATIYHYRAYAMNSVGISYGGDSTFTTASSFVAPIISTGGASAITTTTAICAGNVTSDGGATITNRGICYGNTINPDTTGTKVIATAAIGAFTGNLTGLTAYTLYHYRAYATNSIGISFGGDSTFTTAMDTIYCATIADLRTKIADNFTIYKLSNQVVLTCKLTNRSQKYIQDASAAILIDDPNPAKITTVYNIGDGITGIKGKLENYFGLLEFHPIADPGVATSTANIVNPLVVTAANLQDTSFMKNHQSKLIKLNNVSFTDANGTLAFANGKKYRLTQNTTIDSLFYTYIYNINYITKVLPTVNGNITGVVNLSLNKYYITARDSSDMLFLNTVIPTVITGTTTAITTTTATCAGNIVSDGGATITERGICYGTSVNPDTTTKVIVTGTNASFTGNLINLTASTLYHYRAYAMNSVGLAYGADSIFTTAILVFAPTVTTGTTNAITTTTATCAGNITSDGGATITEKGICYGTSINPDTTTKVIVSGTNASFTGNLINLTASTLYHYRAYAINSIGTSYGADSSFTTTTVGIKENDANKIGIYPNPSNGKFTINVEKFNTGEIRIYTMVGSLILSQEINKANNEFDLSGNGKGMYFIQYINSKSGKSWTEKLIIK